MPIHIVQRDDLDQFVNQMTAECVVNISVVHDQTPAESALGLTGARFLVITKPKLDRDTVEIEVRPKIEFDPGYMNAPGNAEVR